ncbi:SixA phosphatase family protein [Coralliovum pocilloporae]|uniref:SixA phosphatase family protein n=1 Tax=Coralliovum pocilloporae TaxID=3066369 RepID=UPI003306B4CA
MLRLMLLRHAKSSWTGTTQTDFDRTLNERGRRSAALMGHHLSDHRLVPERILCSSAQRCRETLAGLLPYFSSAMDIDVSRPLYDAMDDDYIDHIHAFGGNARSLMLIGHNSATQDTALSLIGSGNPELIEQMNAKFPTAGIAVIDFDKTAWSTITASSGRLVAFFRPRDLAANDMDE